MLADKHTPDVVCHGIDLCTGNCTLFPPPTEGVLAAAAAARVGSDLPDRIRHALGTAAAAAAAAGAPPPPPGLPKICDLPGVRALCDMIYGFANNHDPLEDIDHDGFSTEDTFRGTDWRGKV